MKPLSCALTGHRVLPENFSEQKLLSELENLVSEGYTSFYCGMAEGFDLLALKALVLLKEKYPLEIEACVPYRGQEKSFSVEMKTLYQTLLPKCDRVTVFFERYTDGCYLVRNRYMVNEADCVFAYCTRQKGGTAYTLRYAESKKKRIVRAILCG